MTKIKTIIASIVAFFKGLFTKKSSTPAPVVGTVAPVSGVPAAPVVQTPVVTSPVAAIGYVDPVHANTVIFDPTLGPDAFAVEYAKYPIGTNFVSPTGQPLDNRGAVVAGGFTQANQGG